MRRLFVLGMLAVVLWPPAAAGTESAPRQAWAQTGSVPVVGAAPGRLYVGAVAGAEQSRAFVQLDGAAGAATLSVAEVTTESTLADQAGLAACPLSTPLGADAPTADCTVATPLTRAADGVWSLSLEAWPELGLAIAPVLASPTTTFQVALDPTRTVVTAAGASPASAPEDVGPSAPAVEPQTFEVAPPPPDTVGIVSSPAPPPVPAATSLPARAQRAVAAAAATVLAAASPSAAVVLPLVALLTLGLLWLMRSRPANSPRSSPNAGTSVASSVWGLVGTAALVVLPLLLGEASVYKLGLVLIVIAGAVGLHVLVNWAGELSLAHATLVGLSAFVVAKLSADHGLSPVYLLPVALVVGLVAGAVVGLPALRARGLQVALVTLAAGVAIDRFFFTRTWISGPAGGSQVSTPTFGPFTFTTAKSLYPVLALLVAVSIAAAWVIHRSRLGRGLLWVKAQPDAAAAFGVPVAQYRAVAYALAGACAGMTTLLEVDDATLAFGGLQALGGVSLTVEEGATVGLIGPNGAGKTTLFNSISGLQPLDAGQVRFRGRDVTALRAHRRAALGMGRSFQRLGLMMDTDVRTNVLAAQHLSAGYADVDLLVRPWRWRRAERRLQQRAMDALAAVGLADAADRPVKDLSFATARAVELAAVLVEDPVLMLLDEPTTGLDLTEVVELQHTLERVRAAGTCSRP